MLLCAGCLLASPITSMAAEAVGASETPDAGILAMRGYLMSQLQAMPDLDIRVMGALDIGGRCTPATPCSEGTSVGGVTAVPTQLSTMVCELKAEFDGRVLAQMAIEGRGRGSSCEVAQRDAPLQIAARLLSVLKPEMREWWNEEQLNKMRRILIALGRGTDRFGETAPAKTSEAILEAMDDALRDLER